MFEVDQHLVPPTEDFGGRGGAKQSRVGFTRVGIVGRFKHLAIAEQDAQRPLCGQFTFFAAVKP